jgi:hypothetical protein
MYSHDLEYVLNIYGNKYQVFKSKLLYSDNFKMLMTSVSFVTLKSITHQALLGQCREAAQNHEVEVKMIFFLP